MYKFHGNYFRIWVSDDFDPSDVELEERSLGMKYFFSFYLLFLVEAEEGHKDCILLLDEPGLHLHATAQEKLITFLQKLSERNQLFYSTHSPFMIDGSHLERARAVFESPQGTRVSADVWPRDRDTLFPLQAALGYSVCQTLFVAKRQVLVEGLTDYMLLGVLNHKLKHRGNPGLPEGVVLIPMGGTTNLAPLASMLAGHDVELAILLDHDRAADSALKKLRDIIPDVDTRVLRTRDFVSGKTPEELEELIPADYYLDAVGRAYGKVQLDFTADENRIGNTVDRIQALFDRKGLGKFEKWRPIEVIISDLNSREDAVPKGLFEVADAIFQRIAKVFAK